MQPYQIVGGLGILLALVGGLPAAVGTTNTGLFIFYVVLLLGGLGLIGVSKKLRDQR